MTASTAFKSLNKTEIMDTVYPDLVGRMKHGEHKNSFATVDIMRIMDNAERIYNTDAAAKALYVGYMTNAGQSAVLPAADTFITNVVTVNGDVITAGIMLADGERVQEVGTDKTYGGAAVVSYSVFKR